MNLSLVKFIKSTLDIDTKKAQFRMYIRSITKEPEQNLTVLNTTDDAVPCTDDKTVNVTHTHHYVHRNKNNAKATHKLECR